ncbi:MAG: benzoate-CoA ligase family protein [Candidatus Acidiferrales bacterium]
MALEIPTKFNIAAWFIDRPADAHPERVAILGEPASVTYGELRAMANRAGHALGASGVGRGDRVLLALSDSAEFIAAFFGAAKIGAIAVPVNPFARAADFAYWLRDSGARLAVVSGIATAEFQQALRSDDLPLRQTVLAHVSRPDAAATTHAAAQAAYKNTRQPWTFWEEWLAHAPQELAACDTVASDPAFFLYTSGSTGEPKAAVHQHKDMLVTTECFAKAVMQIGPDDRTLSVSKLFFAYGLGNAMYFPLAAGASTVLLPERPKPDRVLEIVARRRPTIFYSVPTFYAALLQAAEGGAAADFSSVRLAVSAGEALPVEIFARFKKRFGLEILDAIGSTEMLHMFISGRPGAIRPGSCGMPLANYDACIVDDGGREVADGEVGNLWVRGASACPLYWNKPEQTARARNGEWLITGDKFYRDADGYYFYCGRADDMLKVSGLWVAPGEVENALLSHPAVSEAAVVGKLDGAGLTRAVAYVVAREAKEGSADLGAEIQRFVKSKLVPYKCPQEIHFVCELPKTATGKIQRFKLRS